MKFRFLSVPFIALSLATAATAPVMAAGGDVKHPNSYDWSFTGPFGKYDRGALQRGFQVYKEVCAACHSMDLVKFRNLSQPGGPEFTEDQVKALAAEYTVIDAIPDEAGDPVERAALPKDAWPSPWANKEQAQASNNGAYPPDFSLIAKARGEHRGFPLFVLDVFTQTHEQLGPNYIASLLSGYASDEPNEEGSYDNPYMDGGKIAMAPPLSDELVEYTDGTAMTVEQYSQDVAHFLAWAAEPKLEERKRIGFSVMLFLLLFAGLLYATKKQVFASVKH